MWGSWGGKYHHLMVTVAFARPAAPAVEAAELGRGPGSNVGRGPRAPRAGRHPRSISSAVFPLMGRVTLLVMSTFRVLVCVTTAFVAPGSSLYSTDVS